MTNLKGASRNGDPVVFNPLHDNPLRTRAEVELALRDLFAPLLPYFSDGEARVRLDGAGAHFDRAAADLEGFARPLWGIAPLEKGGGNFAHWEKFRQGITNGVDSGHPEYWGGFGSTDQRMVELAAVGFTMCLLPHIIWDPLHPTAKENLANCLLHARQLEYSDSNWKFFRILLDLGLEKCGIEFDRSLTEKYLSELDAFYIGDGWYRDGQSRQLDHYVGFAMHFYGLIYAQLGNGDPQRGKLYRERAKQFASEFKHWFDQDGGTLAFGRSLTYRFACAGFWGALAFSGVEALPWGEIKGLYLRHLRWWAQQPIAHRDGVLSVGYGYPNLLMSESYNSAGSPYWAFKAFLPLALPPDHPFWTAEEIGSTIDKHPIPHRHPGMVMMQTLGNVVALSAGQQLGSSRTSRHLRHSAEKYCKFVYSSRYGFSVEADDRDYDNGAFDGMLGFSDDGSHFRVREGNDRAQIAGNTLYSLWSPWDDVTVETWLRPDNPWHLRVHRISTSRPLHCTEGGFAIALNDTDGNSAASDRSGRAVGRTVGDLSAIVDLGSNRAGRVLSALPNTNLISAKTLVPQLRGEIGKGVTVLATAAFALPAGILAEKALANVPALPDITELEGLFAREGVDVSAIKVR